MLESRYLHLHEALGLGPMWLKQGARLLLPPAEGQDGRFQTASDTAPTVRTAPQPAATVHEDAKQPSGNAHAATLAAIGGASRRQSREPSVPKPAEPAANAANTVSDTLQDGIIPQTQADAARLLAVSICPAPADLAAGRLFSGADGVLLDNMLAAIGLTVAATFGNLPVFTVPHPARMLRQPQLKARAWTELKRLRQYLEAV